MKKTFVLLLALCMAAVLFAVPVLAEGDGNAQPVNTQQALEEALAAAAPVGGTVTLEDNITLTAPHHGAGKGHAGWCGQDADCKF